MSPPRCLFYRDRLGFAITFQGPSDDDIFLNFLKLDIWPAALIAIAVSFQCGGQK
jgi:hypothetical protein